MEENKNCTDGSCNRFKRSCGAIPFLAGLIAALAFGWWVSPDLLFSKEEQPIRFKHSVHMAKSSLLIMQDVTCATCHSFNDDGSFIGIPETSVCASCHDTILTPKPPLFASADEIADYESERRLVEEYIPEHKPIPFKTYQKQPDNVFFSHAAHFEKCYSCHLTMKGKVNLGTPEDPEKLCVQCHVPMKELNQMRAVETNVLTGYSKSTMKMWECESCHVKPGHFDIEGKARTVANNACFTCHK